MARRWVLVETHETPEELAELEAAGIWSRLRWFTAGDSYWCLEERPPPPWVEEYRRLDALPIPATEKLRQAHAWLRRNRLQSAANAHLRTNQHEVNP